jgi:hypothetical protein
MDKRSSNDGHGGAFLMRCGGLATRQANTRMLLVTIISVLVFAFLQQLTRLGWRLFAERLGSGAVRCRR